MQDETQENSPIEDTESDYDPLSQRASIAANKGNAEFKRFWNMDIGTLQAYIAAKPSAWNLFKNNPKTRWKKSAYIVAEWDRKVRVRISTNDE